MKVLPIALGKCTKIPEVRVVFDTCIDSLKGRRWFAMVAVEGHGKAEMAEFAVRHSNGFTAVVNELRNDTLRCY
jgi:hypothetical protein